MKSGTAAADTVRRAVIDAVRFALRRLLLRSHAYLFAESLKYLSRLAQRMRCALLCAGSELDMRKTRSGKDRAQKVTDCDSKKLRRFARAAEQHHSTRQQRSGCRTQSLAAYLQNTPCDGRKKKRRGGAVYITSSEIQCNAENRDRRKLRHADRQHCGAEDSKIDGRRNPRESGQNRRSKKQLSPLIAECGRAEPQSSSRGKNRLHQPDPQARQTGCAQKKDRAENRRDGTGNGREKPLSRRKFRPLKDGGGCQHQDAQRYEFRCGGTVREQQISPNRTGSGEYRGQSQRQRGSQTGRQRHRLASDVQRGEEKTCKAEQKAVAKHGSAARHKEAAPPDSLSPFWQQLWRPGFLHIFHLVVSESYRMLRF